MPGTTPAVLTVTRRFEIPNAKSSVRIAAARTALSKFSSGSPIPIITTLVTPRSSPSARNTSDTMCHLADDLRGRQVAVETLLAG